MEQVDYASILKAIKLDNLVLFSGLVRGNENLRFGRFPLLSLCYLYNAKKIINEHKEELLKITTYNKCAEPLEIYEKFKPLAGRSLRLYVNGKVVTPIEMLAILGQDKKVKSCYKICYKNGLNLDTVNQNLKTIYLIKNQEISFEKEKINITTKRLSNQEKFYHKLAVCLSVLFVILVGSIFSTAQFVFGLGVSFSPFKVYNQTQLYNALKTKGVYELQNNITVTNEFKNVVFNGELNGNGYSLVFANNLKTPITTNNGTIKNLKVVYDNPNIETTQSLSLLVGTNNGEISNINIACKTLTAKCSTAPSYNFYVAGVAVTNNGVVDNCQVKFNANVTAVGGGECMFAGVVGENNGEVKNCNFNGEQVETVEVDSCGICATNNQNAKILNCNNKAQISQSSKNAGWSPTVAGINLTNYGNINNCVNFAKLVAKTTNDEPENLTNVFVGGISALNYGNVFRCLNKGDITANSITSVIYAGGVTAHSTYLENENKTLVPVIDNCGSVSNIDISTENENTFVFGGGISGYLYGDVVASFSTSTFTNGYNKDKCFVGLCLGSAYIEYGLWGDYAICFNAIDNLVLYQSNVNKHVGSLVNNRAVTGGEFDITQGITICFSESDITNGDIYWNETM